LDELIRQSVQAALRKRARSASSVKTSRTKLVREEAVRFLERLHQRR
jgi:hypothetical protein